MRLMHTKRAWVSLPVLFAIAILTWQLIEQNDALNYELTWQTQRRVQDSRVLWAQVYETVREKRASDTPLTSDCVEFCRLSESPWKSTSLDESTILLYQLHKLAGQDVERLCASLDRETARCWWRYQNTTTSSFVYLI